MAHIAVIPTLIGVATGPMLHIQGVARVSDDSELELDWETTVSWTSLTAAGVNDAIKDAALAAAAAQGHTVGLLDNKVLIGGAVGL